MNKGTERQNKEGKKIIGWGKNNNAFFIFYSKHVKAVSMCCLLLYLFVCLFVCQLASVENIPHK